MTEVIFTEACTYSHRVKVVLELPCDVVHEGTACDWIAALIPAPRKNLPR